MKSERPGEDFQEEYERGYSNGKLQGINYAATAAFLGASTKAIYEGNIMTGLTGLGISAIFGAIAVRNYFKESRKMIEKGIGKKSL